MSYTLSQIALEQSRQFAKWGDQSHVSFGGFGIGIYVDLADVYKVANDKREHGRITPLWDLILLEEVYEALSETDPQKQIEELIQVAAVCATAINNLKKRIADNAV